MPSPKWSECIFIPTLARNQLTERVTIKDASANDDLENSKTDTEMESVFLVASTW